MYQNLKKLFTAICDAIRERDGTQAPIAHQDIPKRIAALPYKPDTEPLNKVSVNEIKIPFQRANIVKLSMNHIGAESITVEEIEWSQEL